MPDTTDTTRTGTDVVVRRMGAIIPATLEQVMDFARMIAASELAPPQYKGRPQDIVIAVQMGAELAITPLQALQNIAIINGRATMWGDLVLALVERSGLMESIIERSPSEAFKVKEGRCEVKRIGREAIMRTFSMEDAERAGLLDRSKDKGRGGGPWVTYPGRMLQMRARSWALRDSFADVLKGLGVREEAEDYPVQQIRMPERASTVVDDFLSQRGATGTGPGAPQGPSGATSGGGGAGTWTGKIGRVSERKGKSRTGPWTLYILHGEDGSDFGTFEEGHRDEAKLLGGTPVAIEWEMTPKGNRNVKSIAAIIEGETVPATDAESTDDEPPL